MQVRNLRVGNVPQQDNTTQQLDMPRAAVYREIVLHLTGAPTLTGANNTAANSARMEAWSFIKNIQIIVNGQDTIRQFTGDELAVLNYFLYRVAPKRETTFGDGSTANPSFDRVLRIPFWMPGVSHPDYTLLDARRLSSLTLQIQFGTYTDVNSAATGWTTAPVLEVFYEYIMPRQGQQFGPYATWRQFDQSYPYAANQNGAVITLPVGQLYRGFLLNSNVGGTDTTGILKEFRWKTGSTTYADLTETVLRERFLVQNELDTSRIIEKSMGATANLNLISASTKFNIDAWYFFDMMNSGRLDDGVDSLGFAQMTLENDIVGQANAVLVVQPQLIVPLRKASSLAPTGAAIGTRTNLGSSTGGGPNPYN